MGVAIDNLGPRTRRVYVALRERIVRGELAPGSKLPSHLELAAEFRVAPMTVRQVLRLLEEDELVSREPGRGTFVRAPAKLHVLVVEDDASMAALLCEEIERAGYAAIAAGGPPEGLAALDHEPTIALVLSDVRMPDAATGIRFMRAVRRRWPKLPLAAVTAYPGDLSDLVGTPECPVLIVPKPFESNQIEEVLRLALRKPSRSGVPVSAQGPTPAN